MGAFTDMFKAQKAPAGYSAIPNSKKGGFRKKVGGKWQYWYPDGKGAGRTGKRKASKAAEGMMSAKNWHRTPASPQGGGQLHYMYTHDSGDFHTVSKESDSTWSVDFHQVTTDPQVSTRLGRHSSRNIAMRAAAEQAPKGREGGKEKALGGKASKQYQARRKSVDARMSQVESKIDQMGATGSKSTKARIDEIRDKLSLYTETIGNPIARMMPPGHAPRVAQGSGVPTHAEARKLERELVRLQGQVKKLAKKSHGGDMKTLTQALFDARGYQRAGLSKAMNHTTLAIVQAKLRDDLRYQLRDRAESGGEMTALSKRAMARAAADMCVGALSHGDGKNPGQTALKAFIDAYGYPAIVAEASRQIDGLVAEMDETSFGMGGARPTAVANGGMSLMASLNYGRRMALAKGSKPPAGYSAVPGGKHGGFRKKVGGKWQYWYPSVAAKQNAVERHRDEARDQRAHARDLKRQGRDASRQNAAHKDAAGHLSGARAAQVGNKGTTHRDQDRVSAKSDK